MPAGLFGVRRGRVLLTGCVLTVRPGCFLTLYSDDLDSPRADDNIALDLLTENWDQAGKFIVFFKRNIKVWIYKLPHD